MHTFRHQVLPPLALSLAFHGLVAAGLAFCMGHVPGPDQLAKLDLTSVELSFAETPDETTAAAAPASEPSPSVPPPKPAASEAPPPPEAVPAAEPVLPEPDTADLPQPETVGEKLEVNGEMLRNDRLFEESKAETFNSSLLALNTSSAAPRQARLDAPPRPRRNIRPDYPREARQRGEQGDVTLEIDVNAQGTVDAVRVAKSSGFPLLDEAAVKAAQAAHFTPATSDGKAVVSTARLALSFKLK